MMMLLMMMMMTTLNFCCWCHDDLLNQIQTRNRIGVILYIEGANQDKDGKRTREGKEVPHSFCNKKKYILSCRTRLGTVLMSYPRRGNSYSSSSQERRGRRCGIIIICMIPIGLYIIQRTWHTILIATSLQHHHHHEWSLHCHPCTKCINMTPSYRTINSITQSYVHA